MELNHYLAILRRWGWILLLCVIESTAVSYWFAARQPKLYESQARYLVGPAIDNPNVSSNDLRASSQIGQTYAELATSRPILQNVIFMLNLQADVDTLAQNVTATWTDMNQILTLRVRARDPETAAKMTNGLGEALIQRSPSGPSSLQATRRQEAASQIARLQESIRATQAEIDQLSGQIQQTSDQVKQRVLIVRLDQQRAYLAANERSLSDQYAALQSSNTNQISLVEAAVPNPVPVAPQLMLAVLAALAAGLVLGLSVILALEYIVDVIYTPRDLQKATGLAYLGGIGRHRKLRGVDAARLVVHARSGTSAAEGYRTLRANLLGTNGGSGMRSLLLTSPAPRDGKTEIATNLAAVFAKAGKQVILVDANLRQPKIARLLGLPEHIGLSNLLDQRRDRLDPLPVAAVPGLWVLPAGEPTPNSSEILASDAMRQLIRELEQHSDLVILDSPPLHCSDALTLAPQVDGVLLVARSGRTDRKKTIKAVENLRLAGAHLVGAVLNRVRPEPGYAYRPVRRAERLTWEQPGSDAAHGQASSSAVQHTHDRATLALEGAPSSVAGVEQTSPRRP